MIAIRKADLKDVPIVVELWNEFMKDDDEMVIKRRPQIKPYLIKKKNAADIFRKWVEKNIKSKNAVVLIAEVDGTIAGYSLIFIKDNSPVYKLEKIGYLNDLFVKKEFRGMRISSRLKDEAIKWFKRKGIEHVSIEVNIDNKFAHSVYEQWGLHDFTLEMRRKI